MAPFKMELEFAGVKKHVIVSFKKASVKVKSLIKL